MKVGFGQQKKKTHKKQKKKDKKNKDGDDTMVDAQPTVRPSPEQTDMADAAPVSSAKDKQRQRMELKNALKVQVASLKNKRWVVASFGGHVFWVTPSLEAEAASMLRITCCKMPLGFGHLSSCM
jgi:hypothetical protein